MASVVTLAESTSSHSKNFPLNLTFFSRISFHVGN